MTPSRVPDGQTRGWIVPIGGAEDKLGDEVVLKRFVRVCGGRDARIAVIPTASELSSTGRNYEELFRELRRIKVVELSEERKLLTEFSKKQKDIFKALEIPLPQQSLL